MAMQANHLTVNRVENGWVINVFCAGSHMTLVAKAIDEVVGFIRGMEWDAPRPLPYGDIGGASIETGARMATTPPIR